MTDTKWIQIAALLQQQSARDSQYNGTFRASLFARAAAQKKDRGPE